VDEAQRRRRGQPGVVAVEIGRLETGESDLAERRLEVAIDEAGESRAGSAQEMGGRSATEHTGLFDPRLEEQPVTAQHQVATLGRMKVATSTRIEVGVRDLKNNLSRYLDQVETGVKVVVTDRGRPIARLKGMADEPNNKLAALIEAGLVRPPTSKVRQRPVPLRSSGSVSELVAEQRQ
jgi:prevent-host-death family protein